MAQDITGLVLKEYQTGESGKQIVVLSQEGGKVRLSVRGAKNGKSKLLAATQPFCYSRFFFYEGRGFVSVNRAELVENFYHLREDVKRLSYGVFLLDLVEKTVLEGMEEGDVLPLLLRTLAVMEKGSFPPDLATDIFLIKYLQLNGLLGGNGACSSCGAKEITAFSFSAGGLVCASCAKNLPDCRTVLPATAKAFSFVQEREKGRIFGFTLSEEAHRELHGLLKQMVWREFGAFRTLEFAERME